MPTLRDDAPPQPLITCEHATNRVPREYAPLFRANRSVLATHRAFDPGALALAEHIVHSLPDAAPLLRTTVSRLLVECNRSPHHPKVFSEFTRNLDKATKAHLLATFYHSHRDAVRAQVNRTIAARRPALHIGVHSFTPVLDGVPRTADIGLLYDPARPREIAFAARWMHALRTLDPSLRVRRNYPYRGASDGLTTSLRREFPPTAYLGIELEVNNALLTPPAPAPARRHVHRVITQSLHAALADPRPLGA